MKQPRNDKGQRRERTRSAEHAARKPKGHPKREARRQRAYDRGAPRPKAAT